MGAASGYLPSKRGTYTNDITAPDTKGFSCACGFMFYDFR